MQILTLSTDIGHRDYIVGAVKGQLLSKNQNLIIADITHFLSTSNFPQAAYICSNAFKFYPANSIHIILLNVFENFQQQILIAHHKGKFIICPDNGILTMITGEKPVEIVSVDIKNKNTFLQITESVAIAVDQLSKGLKLNEIGNSINSLVEKFPLRPTVGNDWIDGQILFIDRFENVIVNITQNEFEEQRKGRSFKIIFKRNEVIDVVSSNYSSVNEGEKMAWFNSAGYLEIAMNKGNIAGLFGLQGFNEKMHEQASAVQNKWFYQTVRVFFE
jgi:hypothetical protein